MINFLKNWIEGIAIAVILVSIFEMLLPEGNLKKYIKVVLGIYIVFSIISPFVNNKELYSFNFIDEVENITTSSKSQMYVKDNIEEMYTEALQKKIISEIKQYGYDVKNCKIDAIFAGNEEEIGIKKIFIILNPKKLNKIEVNEIENVVIDINSKDKKIEEKNITQKEIENLKKVLSENLGIDKKTIFIQGG